MTTHHSQKRFGRQLLFFIMHVIDLTLTLSPSIRGFNATPAKTLEKDGWNAACLHLYSHGGTHMDAPFHFGVTDERIDEIPVARFLSKAWVVTVACNGPGHLITVADLAPLNGKLQRGESVIVRTSWSRHAGTERYYTELPRISEEAACWLVEKGVNILAVEPPSVADVGNLPEVTTIHRILLEGGVLIVEGICNTEQLTAESVQLIALPLKIFKGDGAPARVVALQTENNAPI